MFNACHHPCLACILSYEHLVSMVFGMVTPTSSYTFMKCFYACFTGFSLYSRVGSRGGSLGSDEPPFGSRQ